MIAAPHLDHRQGLRVGVRSDPSSFSADHWLVARLLDSSTGSRNRGNRGRTLCRTNRRGLRPSRSFSRGLWAPTIFEQPTEPGDLRRPMHSRPRVAPHAQVQQHEVDRIDQPRWVLPSLPSLRPSEPHLMLGTATTPTTDVTESWFIRQEPRWLLIPRAVAAVIDPIAVHAREVTELDHARQRPTASVPRVLNDERDLPPMEVLANSTQLCHQFVRAHTCLVIRRRLRSDVRTLPRHCGSGASLRVRGARWRKPNESHIVRLQPLRQFPTRHEILVTSITKVKRITALQA